MNDRLLSFFMIGSFAYSVPTKVILFGEHAVVHGHPAVSMAINNRMFMTGDVTESQIPEVIIRYKTDTFSFNPSDPILQTSPPLEKLYRTAFSPNFPSNRRLILTFSIARECTGGLGTSASLSVLLAAASRRISQTLFSPADLFQPAKQFESFFHSNSSGLDVATVLQGSAIRFQRSVFAAIKVPDIPLLIVDTGIPRQTRVAVDRVRDLLAQDGERIGGLLEELGALSDGFVRTPDDQKKEFIFGNFGCAQEKLVALGLSCPAIDEIVERAKANGLTAKLSGAGLGGIVLVAGEGVYEKERLFEPFARFRVSADVTGFREE
jgi:mevalonate kinase